MESRPTPLDTFKMEASLKRFLITYSGAFTIGVVLTFVFANILMKSRHLIFVLVVVPLFAYVFNDLFSWLRRGVRSLEMDSTGLKIHFVRKPEATRIEASDVTAVYSSRFLDRTTVNILLKGATARRFLGIRVYSGPRIRMTNDPFDKSQFHDFVRRITNLRHTSHITQ